MHHQIETGRVIRKLPCEVSAAQVLSNASLSRGVRGCPQQRAMGWQMEASFQPKTGAVLVSASTNCVHHQMATRELFSRLSREDHPQQARSRASLSQKVCVCHLEESVGRERVGSPEVGVLVVFSLENNEWRMFASTNGHDARLLTSSGGNNCKVCVPGKITKKNQGKRLKIDPTGVKTP